MTTQWPSMPQQQQQGAAAAAQRDVWAASQSPNPRARACPSCLTINQPTGTDRTLSFSRSLSLYLCTPARTSQLSSLVVVFIVLSLAEPCQPRRTHLLLLAHRLRPAGRLLALAPAPSAAPPSPPSIPFPLSLAAILPPPLPLYQRPSFLLLSLFFLRLLLVVRSARANPAAPYSPVRVARVFSSQPLPSNFSDW